MKLSLIFNFFESFAHRKLIRCVKATEEEFVEFNLLMIGIQMSNRHLRGQLFVTRLVSYDRINRHLSNSPSTFQVSIGQAQQVNTKVVSSF